MKINKCLKGANTIYTEYPEIMVPYVIFSAINTLLFIFLRNYFTHVFPKSFNPMAIANGLSADMFFKGFLLFLIVLGFMIFVRSYTDAYALGLIKATQRKKTLKLSDGFKAMKHGFNLFVAKLVIGLIISISLFVLVAFSVILFGLTGLVAVGVVSIIIVAFTLIATFFVSQQIVLNKKGSWAGIVASYKFVRSKLDSTLVLAGFVVLIYFVFAIITRSWLKLGELFFSKAVLDVFYRGFVFLVNALFFYPYVIILKTYFFIKNQPSREA